MCFGPSGLFLALWLQVAIGGGALADDDHGHNDSGQGQTSADNDHHDNGLKDQTQPDGALNAHELSESPEQEQEEVRQAVASGKAAPLTQLLLKLKAHYPGQILNVALVRKSAKLNFVVKYIDPTGLVKIVSFDALTLEDE